MDINEEFTKNKLEQLGCEELIELCLKEMIELRLEELKAFEEDQRLEAMEEYD